MWIMTKYGFFSVVCAWKSESDRSPHESLLMVRARCSDHLCRLVNQFGSVFPMGTKIEQSYDTDYPFRVFIDKRAWGLCMQELVQETDYCNFKNEAKSNGASEPYMSFLHDVWYEGTMLAEKSRR